MQTSLTGGDIKGQLDPSGVPVIKIGVTLSTTTLITGTTPGFVTLVIDDKNAQLVRNYPHIYPFQAELRWWPTKLGTQSITINATDGNLRNTQRLTFNVTEMPTPPITQRFIELYKQKFNLNLTTPPVSRQESRNPGETQWVSAVYVGDTLYTINLPEGGKESTFSIKLNSSGKGSDCRPAGKYRLLSVFVDYGNTGISKDVAMAALKKQADITNLRYAAYSKQRGLSSPILQFEVTGAFIAAPPPPAKLLTPDQIKAFTGFDPAQFNVIAQLDLDSAGSYKKTLDSAYQGLSWGGCWGNPKQPDIWIDMPDSRQLDFVLDDIFLNHELLHSMGWKHPWPCENNISTDDLSCRSDVPTYLFGWDDLDGDGVIEILDPTPYGLKPP